MAVTMRMEFSATTDQYDEIWRRLDIDNNPPDGLIAHACAEVDGGLRVVDIWESPEKFEAFNNSTLGPMVMEVLGEPPPDAPPPGQPEITELHNVYTA